MKTKKIALLFGALASLLLVAFNSTGIEKPDRSLVIPPPAWKHDGGWNSGLTLFQVESLSGITAADGIDPSWVSWLQTSLCGLVLEPKSYDNDPRVMVAYGLLGNGNHYSDLMNHRVSQRRDYINAQIAAGATKENAEKSAPSYWKMLIGDKFDTKEKKDSFLAWCMEQSHQVLWTLSKEESEIYTNQMWSAYDAVGRPGWLEKEKAYYAELEKSDKVSQFVISGPDGKTDGRKLVCFIYRRCLDGSTTPEEALTYMKTATAFFEKESQR